MDEPQRDRRHYWGICMNHKRIVRGLVWILVIVLVVICIILACPPVRAAECRLGGKPQPTPWEPDKAEVEDVILNRVADPRFQDTIEAVLTAPGQYGRFSKTGIVWPKRASNPGEAHAVQRAYDTAYDLLSGNHSELYGAGYVWQAEFSQGSGFWLDGLYFGK